jgi:hypothetical protein
MQHTSVTGNEEEQFSWKRDERGQGSRDFLTPAPSLFNALIITL